MDLNEQQPNFGLQKIMIKNLNWNIFSPHLHLELKMNNIWKCFEEEETSEHYAAFGPWIPPYGALVRAVQKYNICIEGVCYRLINHIHVCPVFIRFPQKTCDFNSLNQKYLPFD